MIVVSEAVYMSGRCNAGENIAVLIADSDHIRRQLLIRELQRNSLFRVTGCSSDVVQCREALSAFPAKVLVWAESSQCDAKQVFSGMRDVFRFWPSLLGVVLLESWEKEAVIDGFRSGVHGLFSLEQGSLDELRKCILCVSRGEVWASNEQVLALVKAFKRSLVVRIANVKGQNLLTPRQQELVELVAEGMGNREVAQHLNITENTVKKSLLRVFDKVGVSNRVELVLSALASRNAEAERELDRPVGKEPARAKQITEDSQDELA